jgi:hypothetical protein
MFEIGEQNAISVGLVHRVDMAPEVCSRRNASTVRGEPSEAWKLNIFYREEEFPTTPLFRVRETWGVDASVGLEKRGVSAGYDAYTSFWPHENGFHVLVYDAAKPLSGLLCIWPYQQGNEAPIPEGFEYEEDSP